MLLKNKIILITGSTTGIGEATARRCVEEGAHVMIHGRNEARAKKLVGEFKGQSDYILADISNPDNCEKIVTATIKRFGALHAIINNAASTMRNDISTTEKSTFDYLINVNLKAPLLISQAAIRQFRHQGHGGTILNIGSINAYCGESVLLVYSITKAGLMTMTRNLADSLGTEKIRVNQLNVGWTTTPNEIALKIQEGMSEDWFNHVPSVFAPTGKLLTPENVAEHILFWISDKSAPTSGCICEVEQYPLIGRNKITAHSQTEDAKKR
jgi:NAD(P)-dependent dehydrogenase (short-subunit alcohol dehydrogenase family)